MYCQRVISLYTEWRRAWSYIPIPRLHSLKPSKTFTRSHRQDNIISRSASESLIAVLCGLLTLNIYALLPLLNSIPPLFDLLVSAPLYVLSLQGLISLAATRLFYIATRCRFRFECRKTLVLLLLYAVFPVPRLAIWVLDTVVPSICVRKGFCKVCRVDACWRGIEILTAMYK
jgi:hypothetical protein